MGEQSPDCDSFLAGLDTKIAALQQLRESYVAALSVGALGPAAVDVAMLSGIGWQPASGPVPLSGPIELPTGVFRNQGLADAIRLYLSIAKRKQTTKEITAALRDGGLATTSVNFGQTLKATLYRLRDGGEVLQFKDGWDLAESYPEGFRQRLAQQTDTAPRRMKKSKRRRARKGEKPEPKATAVRNPKDERPKEQPEVNPILRAI